MFHQGPTISASVLALLVAAGIWIVGRQRWPRTTVFLVIGGAGGIVGTRLGHVVHQAIAWFFTQIGPVAGHLLGVTIAFVAVAAAIALAIVVGFHVHHQAVSRWTLGFAALIPWAVPFVPAGPVATGLGYIVSFAADVVGSLGYLLFNGHL
jgi:hypothetical protein